MATNHLIQEALHYICSKKFVKIVADYFFRQLTNKFSPIWLVI